MLMAILCMICVSEKLGRSCAAWKLVVMTGQACPPAVRTKKKGLGAGFVAELSLSQGASI